MKATRNLIYLTLGVLLWVHSPAVSQIMTNFKLFQEEPDSNGLVGNGVTDLVWQDGVLYAATGFGLSVTRDLGSSWQNFTPTEYGGKGGISALAVAADGTIWIATAYDTTVEEGQSLAVGGGLRYLPPGSSEWVFIPQPRDARDDTLNGKRPTTTAVQNVTFDIAFLDNQIWIASFGGGIRRSLDGGQTWEVVTTDGKPFSALDYLNHRGFAVMAENGNIWVGTADGISKSIDGGQTWTRFRVENGEPEPGGISGNWCIALAYNPWDGSVWAATLPTGGNEYFAISKTPDGGQTWEICLKEELSDGAFPRNIAFYDSVTYVATEKGVFKSVDGGKSWYQFPAIVDSQTGEQLLTNYFYSVATSPLQGVQHRLWVGSSDGLAMTADNGFTWTIFRSFVSTTERTDPAVYAYPNPFSPARGNYIRFQYDISAPTTVEIEIFNFALEKVVTLTKTEAGPVSPGSDRSLAWDGRDSNGRLVDNGVYFFRAHIQDKVTWGKIVVIN